MNAWSVALDVQAELWIRCRGARTYEELLEKVVGVEPVGRSEPMIEDMSRLFLQLPPSEVPAYYFSPQTCALLREASRSYPLDSFAPPPRLFMSESGFWYFAEPIGTTADGLEIRAIIWIRQEIEGHQLIFFAACTSVEGSPWIVPGFFGQWPDEVSIAEAVQQTIKPTAQDIVSGDVDYLNATRPILQVVLQFFGAGASFCHQRIFLDKVEKADRATRRRLAAEAGPVAVSDVHVVTLRRAEQTEPEGEREVEWSCRWWVRGHWRRQAVGVDRAERLRIWIVPHIKGPEDKPLKPRVPTTYAVTR